MHTDSRKKRLREQGLLSVKGFCVGTADIIPGVSGGTMAFILGIYPQLMAAIKSFDLVWLKSLFKFQFSVVIAKPHFHFFVPLLIGVVAALLFFTQIIELPQLLVDYPEEIYGLFFGLIAGSIVVLLIEFKDISGAEIGILLVGALAGLVVLNLVPSRTPEHSWFIFLAGVLSICAMILPGISGSFILLILNKYAYIFNAIGYFNLSVLIPFGLGAITGLVLFSRFLSFLLHRYYRPTMCFIIGILMASLSVIWPFQERIYEIVGGNPSLVDRNLIFPLEISSSVLISLTLTITGFMVILEINQLKKPIND